MHIEVTDEKNTVIYPSVGQNSRFDSYANPSVIVTKSRNEVTLIHRRINTGGKWQLVPFSSLRKEEFQRYINKLQEICNALG